MGQKTHPIGLRVAVTKDWQSKWFAEKQEFAELLEEDRRIRSLLMSKLDSAAVTKVLIERATGRCRIKILTARPGVVIGRRGAEIDKIKEDLSRMTGKEVYVDIEEIRQPEVDAQLVAENVAMQFERRIAHRRAMKRVVQTAMEFGAEGIRIRAAGRLGGRPRGAPVTLASSHRSRVSFSRFWSASEPPLSGCTRKATFLKALDKMTSAVSRLTSIATL